MIKRLGDRETMRKFETMDSLNLNARDGAEGIEIIKEFTLSSRFSVLNHCGIRK